MSKKRYYSLRAFASYLKRYKYRFPLVVFVFVIANVLVAVLPLFIGRLVGALAAPEPDRQQIYWQVMFLAAASAGHAVAWHGAEFLYIRYMVEPNNRFGDLLFRHVIKKPYPFFVDKFTGKIGSYVTDLTREYREFMGRVCYSYLNLAVQLPVIALIMFSVNLYTGVIFLLSITTMLLVGRHTIRPAMRSERRVTDKDSGLNGYIIDAISNFVNVKAFRKTAAEAEYISSRRAEVIKAVKPSFKYDVLFWVSMSTIVRVVLWPGTIVLNVWLFLEGRISVEQVSIFTAALLVFSNFIWSVVWEVKEFNSQLARIEEAYRYLFGKRNVVREDELMNADSGSVNLELNSSLELKNLNFSYPDSEKPVLHGINLALSKKEKTGIVGHSGSGKTTLVKLLLGYYDLPRQTVLLDGQPLDNRILVNLISYVPQDTSLFHRTIAENIAYGTNGNPDHDAVARAGARAHADEFIKETPKGYDTMVGEKGIKLSMGQRQRIAIARAFLDDKPLLILDEATSALDSESEALVQKALEDLWSDKTVIAIAHRLSTLRHMDRIVVMDNGRIVEDGSHQKLIKQKGQYYSLWQHQHDGLIGD